jgi:hypothetical protein
VAWVSWSGGVGLELRGGHWGWLVGAKGLGGDKVFNFSNKVAPCCSKYLPSMYNI